MVDIEFDREALENYGRPKHFDPDHYLDAVEQMICADEIQTALYMLDHLPGWYRDNVPERAKRIRAAIFQNLMTVFDYASDKDESSDGSASRHQLPVEDQIDTAHYFPRAQAMVELMEHFKSQSKSVHIFEFGPANYWLPLGLRKKGFNFTYEALSLNAKADAEARVGLGSIYQPEFRFADVNIFACFEVIEHLWNPDDIHHAYLKARIDADVVAFSTPMYTIYNGLPNWDSRELGHIRTYTPNELIDWASKRWTGYSWQLLKAPMMVLVGRKLVVR